MKKIRQVLIGNSFPLSLIRRRAVINPLPLEDLRKELSHVELHSFWGHSNTLQAASAIAGKDLTPHQERPVIQLSSGGLPFLNEIEFRECLILSPKYIESFRPQIGEEVSADKIKSWQLLKITWEDKYED